jgi:ribonuclease Z
MVMMLARRHCRTHEPTVIMPQNARMGQSYGKCRLSMSLSVTLLGTGGPRRDPTRRSAALLPRTGEEEVLIDAGRGAIHGLAEAGADFSRLTRLVLTHHHFDHVGDLYDVMLTTWLEGREERLLVEGPPDTARLVNALLTQVYDKDLTWRTLGEPAHGSGGRQRYRCR